MALKHPCHDPECSHGSQCGKVCLSCKDACETCQLSLSFVGDHDFLLGGDDQIPGLDQLDNECGENCKGHVVDLMDSN